MSPNITNVSAHQISPIVSNQLHQLIGTLYIHSTGNFHVLIMTE